jgi:hypothetical protein
MNVMNDYANPQERYTYMLINEEVKIRESLQMEFDGKWKKILVNLGGVMKTKIDALMENIGNIDKQGVVVIIEEIRGSL